MNSLPGIFNYLPHINPLSTTKIRTGTAKKRLFRTKNTSANVAAKLARANFDALSLLARAFLHKIYYRVAGLNPHSTE